MAGDPTGIISHADEFHRGHAWKRPVRVATTASITISTALNNGDTLDGVTLATGDRVLVKDQSTGSQNGIYVVGASPARAFDWDQDLTTAVPAEESLGALVYVIAGTVNGGTIWRCTNTTSPTLGSTALTFAQVGASGLADMGTATYLDFTTGSAPSSPASGKVRLYSLTGDHMYQKDSGGTATALDSGGGGGGVSSAFLGYNTVGGSNESVSFNRWYFKKITTTGACVLQNIGVYFKETNDAQQALHVALMEDNAGAIGKFIANSHSSILAPTNNSSFGGGTASVARWFDLPITASLAASTSYWIGHEFENISGAATTHYYDTGGSDRYWTGGPYIVDGGRFTETDSTFKFSMRALTIS